MKIKRYVLVLINTYQLINLVVSYLSCLLFVCYLLLLIGICNRKDICGTKSIFCSEQSSSLKPTDGGPYFACFCSSALFLIGQKCPEEMPTSTSSTKETIISTKITTNDPVTTTVDTNSTTAIPIITTTTPSVNNTTTPSVNNTTTQKVITCDSSHLYIGKILIILLNLVYFLNK